MDLQGPSRTFEDSWVPIISRGSTIGSDMPSALGLVAPSPQPISNSFSTISRDEVLFTVYISNRLGWITSLCRRKRWCQHTTTGGRGHEENLPVLFPAAVLACSFQAHQGHAQVWTEKGTSKFFVKEFIIIHFRSFLEHSNKKISHKKSQCQFADPLPPLVSKLY